MLRCTVDVEWVIHFGLFNIIVSSKYKYDEVISKLFHFITNLLGLFGCSFINFKIILRGSIYFLIKLDKLRSKISYFFRQISYDTFFNRSARSTV